MNEIKDLRKLLSELRTVIDRMAGGIEALRVNNPEIEGAKDMLWLARRIKDEQLLVLTVSNAISIATSTKRKLMNVYEMNCEKTSDSIRIKEQVKRAEDAMRAWALLTECVRIEFDGYELLGEDRACYECLSKYAVFLFYNKLYERDSVFWLFSNLPVKDSEPLLNEDLIRAVCEYCNCFA